MRIRDLVFCLIAATTPAPALWAQEGPERAAIDSLFAELSALDATQPIPGDARCAAYGGTLGRLCRATLAVRRVGATPETGPAFDAEMALRRVVDERPQWATGWYMLAMARLQLSRAGVLAREGVRQPMGVSAEAGAGLALVTALELEPRWLVAAEALALAPLPREGASQLGERRDALRRIRRGVPLSPDARLGIAVVERESGNPDSAIVMLREAMHAGADSGVVHLELARMLHKAGHPAAGRRALIAGAGMTASARANARYREEIAWVASPPELAAWDSLPVAERSRWFEAFWTEREVRDGRAPGERLSEHYRRYEEAMREFLIRVPQKGRQRVRSVAMAGDVLDATAGDAPGRAGATTRQGVEGGDLTREAIEQQRVGASEYAAVAGAAVPFREFGITQDVLDDRGVVWIRHGQPTERTLTSGGTAMEAWRYARSPEPDLVLFFAEADFDGTSAPSVLVPTPAASGGRVIAQLCGRMLGMCDDLARFAATEGPLNSGVGSSRRSVRSAAGRDPNGGAPSIGVAPVPTDVIRAETDRGRTQIDRGVTSDDYSQVFDALLRPAIQIHGVDRGGAGASRLLVSFAVPGDRIVGTNPSEAGGRTVYPIRIQVLSTVRGTGARFDLDTVRQFATSQPLGAGQYLTATVELPVPPGTYLTTVVLSQPDGRGALSRLEAVSAPGAGGQLSISSLVLGREGSGTRWNSGTRAVPLNPLNAFPGGSEAELYYQLNGVSAGAAYQTRIDFFPAADGESRSALSLSFTDEPATRFVEVQRTIGLRNLRPGSYRMRVTVTGGGAVASEEAILSVVRDP